MKFLIIRFSSIGDIVLTTPVIRCLHKKFPEAEIHYLTKKQFHGVLSANPYITKFHFLEEQLSETIKILQEENYTAIIDLHKNIRSLKVKRALKVPAHTFDKLNIEKWLRVNLKINKLPPIHIVDRYLKALSHWHVENDGDGLDFFIEEKEISDAILPIHNSSYIAFAIGANHATKRLPEYKILELCKHIPHKIILLGGKDEAETGTKINNLFPEKVINYCGKINLNESAYIIKNAACVITHDTGMMHIAAAYKKQIISVWGNTIPEFGMYPYFGTKGILAEKSSRMFEVKNLACRPCSKIGYEKCPKGHFKCMNNIDVQQIAKFVSGVY